MKIHFEGAKTNIIEAAELVSGTVNYFTVSFTFNAEWNKFLAANSVWVVFENGATIKEIQVTAYEYFIPKEILGNSGQLYLGAYGKFEGETLTTDMSYVCDIISGARGII